MKQGQPLVVNLDRARLFRWLFVGLAVTQVVLVLLDAVITEFGAVEIGAARRLFNITREDSMPNFFSSMLLLANGGVLLGVTLAVRARSPRVVVGWGIVTALFLFMGMDDATKLHERLGSIFSWMVTDEAGEPHGHILGRLYDVYPSYTWQLVVGPIFAALGIFLVIFLYKGLPSWHMRGLATAAIGLFVVAVGLDFAEGLDSDLPGHIGDFFSTSADRVIHFSKSIEELSEMAGATILLFVFMRKLLSLTPSITVVVSPVR